jgi:hypothetical protein
MSSGLVCLLILIFTTIWEVNNGKMRKLRSRNGRDQPVSDRVRICSYTPQPSAGRAAE